MSRWAGPKKQKIALLLAAWPAAVVLGWLIARVTHADWPIAACAVAWLAILFCVLRRERVN